METIGINIVEMQQMINTLLIPVPNWIRQWQLDAEHVLAMAHYARDEQDFEKLRMLDEEAKKLIDERNTKLNKKKQAGSEEPL